MSGHSKWSTIKHQKGVADKKRGHAFSKAVRLITLAVREGGSADPTSNFRLRLAIDKAKAINMPKDNIERAITRGAGEAGGGGLARVLYEGFGPRQTAVLVECVTDNKNRTLSSVKTFFDKRGCSLGSAGSASYLFDQKGKIAVKKDGDKDEMQLKLMDYNPDDILDDGDVFSLIYQPKELQIAQEQLEREGFKIVESGLVYLAKSPLTIDNPEHRQSVATFVQNLNELDDVENVFVNTSL